MTLAENLEVLNLRAVAGQYDLQERHTALAKLPVFLENRAKVGYDVRLDPALNGSDATLQTNQAYEADPEIAKWLHTTDFRRALSMPMSTLPRRSRRRLREPERSPIPAIRNP